MNNCIILIIITFPNIILPLLHNIYSYLYFNRALRERRYNFEVLEVDTNDILDRALIKAKANRDLGAIDAPTYHILVDKIHSLKKLKFT